MTQEGQAAEETKQLVGLLEYQDDSIVSRVLLKNQGGTITLFAFDAGSGLSEHTAPFDALAAVLDGEAEIEIVERVTRFERVKSLNCPQINLMR